MLGSHQRLQTLLLRKSVNGNICFTKESHTGRYSAMFFEFALLQNLGSWSEQEDRMWIYAAHRR